MRANSKKTKSKKSSRRAAPPLSSSSRGKLSGWYGKLYPEQVPAADFLVQRLKYAGGAALVSEQGTGKTIITLAVLEKLNLDRILIVTPKTSIHVTWLSRIPSATVVGYEAFRNAIKRIMKQPWDIVIFDESQALKGRNSRQSRAARRLRHLAKRRLILSGTPLDKSPVDFWAQMRFVDPSVFGDVWQRPRNGGDDGPYFAEEFCRPAGFMGKKWEFVDRKLPQFLERIAPYVYRLENTMEQPEYIHVPVGLYGHQRRTYDQMERHGIVKLNGHKSVAGLAPVRDLRCFQIVGGFLEGHRVGEAKQRKLKTLLPTLIKPVVFCRFLPEVEEVRRILCQRYRRVTILNGSIKDKKNNLARTQLLNDFQAGKIDALVCQARTGGVSIELTKSNELVFYSMGYSYIDFQQIIARFRRYGQTKRVKVFLLVAQDTVDEEPLDRIRQKSQVVEPVMAFFKGVSDDRKERNEVRD